MDQTKRGVISARIEALVVAAAWIMALAIVATTIGLVWAGYSPVPYWDEWDASFPDRYDLGYFFAQHNEHRIALPKVFFWLDVVLGHGNRAFLLCTTLVLQTAQATLLGGLVARASGLGRNSRLLLAAVTTGLCFSGMQAENFTWGFQIQIVLIYFAASCAFAALARLASPTEVDRAPPAHHAFWLGAVLFSGFAATYSMANGLLVWPLLVVLGAWQRLDRRYIAALGAAGALAWAVYLKGYVSAPHHASPVESLFRLPRVVAFAAAYLGAPPMAWVAGIQRAFGHRAYVTWQIAATLGSVGLLAAGGILIRLHCDKKRLTASQVTLVGILMLVGASAFVTALGRINFSLKVALASRYLTAGLLFCGALAVLGASHLSHAFKCYRPVWKWGGYVALLVILGGLLVRQPTDRRQANDRSAVLNEAGLALAVGVCDPVAWGRLHPSTQILAAQAEKLRNERLSVFAEEWTHWMGTPFSEHFARVDALRCEGGFAAPAAVTTSELPQLRGARVSGWAWDKEYGRPPELVVLIDNDGRIAGFAATGRGSPEPESAGSEGARGRAGWSGYVVGGPPTSLTAYAVMADERTACPLEQQRSRPEDVLIPAAP